MATIIVPTPYRKLTGGKAIINLSAPAVNHNLNQWVESFPEIGRHLSQGCGKIRGLVNIFVEEQYIRDLQRTETRISDQKVISIVPAISGGFPILSGNNKKGIYHQRPSKS